MLLDIGDPVLSGLILVVVQLRRPRPLDNVAGALALHDDLVTQAARLGQDLEVQGVGQVAAVDLGPVQGVSTVKLDGAARLGAKELRDHAEGVLAVDGEVFVLLGPAVALGVEELDVGLARRETHGVPPRAARRRFPELRVGHALVEARVGEGAEGERRQEPRLLVLPLLVRVLERIAVVDQVVVGQPRLCRLVEHEDDEVVHEVAADARQVHEGRDPQGFEVAPGADPRAVEDVGAAVGAAAHDNLLCGNQSRGGAVRLDDLYARCLQLTLRVGLEYDFVDVCLNQDGDVVFLVVLGYKVGTGSTNALMNGAWRMPAPLGSLPMREHVVVQGHAF